MQSDRLRFFEAVTSINALRIFRSPATVREQLFANFVTEFGTAETIPDGRQILETLRDWFTASGKAMVAATDCLLLTQYGHDTKQEQYAMEGRKWYGVALRTLQQELCKPQAGTNDDLLVVTDALSVCESLVFRNLPSEPLHGEEAWRKYARGMCSLLAVRGPQCLASLCQHNRDVVFNAMFTGIADCMSTPKALTLGEPAWQQALEASCCGRMWCLFHIACRFPALLERMDKMALSADPETEALAVLTNLADVEGKFQTWLLAWYDDFTYPLVRTSSITNYDSFVARHGPLVDQFPQVFTFASFVEALGLLAYWTMLLFVKEAIYDLSMRPYAIAHTTKRERKGFNEGVYECADAICQSVPYFLETKRGMKGARWRDCGGDQGLFGSICWSARWYEKQGDIHKAEFCKSVIERDLHVFGEPSSPSPTSADSWWLVGKVILLKRLLWQRCVGPTTCALKPEVGDSHDWQYG